MLRSLLDVFLFSFHSFGHCSFAGGLLCSLWGCTLLRRPCFPRLSRPCILILYLHLCVLAFYCVGLWRCLLLCQSGFLLLVSTTEVVCTVRFFQSFLPCMGIGASRSRGWICALLVLF